MLLKRKKERRRRRAKTHGERILVTSKSIIVRYTFIEKSKWNWSIVLSNSIKEMTTMLNYDCSNSQAILTPLNRMISRAWDMSQSRAFLHHFEKYGLPKEHMESSIIALEQTLQDYRSLT